MDELDLYAIMAANLLAGSVKQTPKSATPISPNSNEITQAVRTAKRIWKEVLKRDNEE